MNAQTPGQAARDVVAAHLQRQLPPEIPMSWDNVSAEDRGVWESAAQAAIDASEYVRQLERDAAQQWQPAPGLREALEAKIAVWRDYSQFRPTDTRDEITEQAAVEECAGELAAILAEHPEPQPAPGPAGCECGHAQTGHAFSDDVCAVPECPCSGYRSTPRAAPELAAAIDPDKLDLLADWFDADDIAKGRAGRTEVQEDLRRWATAVRDHRERAGLPS